MNETYTLFQCSVAANRVLMLLCAFRNAFFLFFTVYVAAAISWKFQTAHPRHKNVQTTRTAVYLNGTESTP